MGNNNDGNISTENPLITKHNKFTDMKKILIIFLSVTFLIGNAFTQDYLTVGVISKVINIKVGNSTGSSFIIYEDGKSYLVTAKHVLGNVKNKQIIAFEFYKDSLWMKTAGTALLHSNTGIDIAVIDLNDPSERKNHIGLTTHGLVYGDEGYFLGFPYGLKVKNKEDINAGLPFPLVKKAIISAIFNENGIITLFLDGHNNPGFSGGPIVFRNIDEPKKHKWNIVGVVSGYKPQNNEINTPFGKMKYNENSGIMIGYGIEHVFEIIQKNN